MMRFCLSAVVCFVAGISCTRAAEPKGIELDPVVAAAEARRVNAIQRAIPSAVSVFIPGGGGGGSGVLISEEGYALTNFHVTSPAGTFMRCGLSDGRVYDAVLVGLDPVGDLAMIKLLGRDDFPRAGLADSLQASPGDWCMVIGNPFLLATNLQPTVTWGILSGVGRYQYPAGTLLEYADCLQTDASVNPGNSGGPLYNDAGDLLGVVGRCSFEKRGRVNVGVGYAISINQAKNFLGYLRSGRIVDHATLGATVSTDPDGGVVVSNILASSDAYRRGLRYNSEILEIDGRPVSTANEVQNVLGTLPAGWRVMIAFREEGKTIRVPVRLMSVHRRDELIEKMGSALPPPPPVPDQPEPKKESEDGESPKEGETPQDQQPPSPHGGMKPAVKKSIPEAAAKLIEERRGYANYHFNRLEQTRFYEQLKAMPNEATTGLERWQITGKTPNGETCRLMVRDDEYAMDVGQFAFSATRINELFDAVDQDMISGALAALDAWRKMTLLGPQQFGETYYKGTMPLSGERPLRDCTVGLYGDMEVRWLMHPDTGLLECIEVVADRDSDPAELWIGWDGDRVDSLELRYGVDAVLSVAVESWDRGEKSE
ncbi:MAG: trypsin-like peptidase domain-containing protein [Planctomycetota bacterium]